MFTINRNQINSYIQGVNLQAFSNAYLEVNSALENSMNSIISRNPLINKYEVRVANEALSGTAIASSSIDLFLILDAMQMELNYNIKRGRSLAYRTRKFFDDFKQNFVLFRRKKKSTKKIEKEDKKFEEETNYNIETFFKDLKLQLSKNLTQSTKIYVYGNNISVVNKGELGVDVNIYPIFAVDEDKYNLYNIATGRKIEISFRERFENVEMMYEQTNHMSKVQNRILNCIYYNIFKTVPNQIFIESLLFNIPINLYSSNIVDTTSNIISYLKNSNFAEFKSICDENVLLFSEPLNTTKIETAYKFIRNITIV